MVPALAAAYFTGTARSATGSPSWLLTYTPLHIFWAGREAVYVFFILSGLVLALPFVRRQRPPWRVYYPRRIVRLYLPVIAAVIVGTAIAVLTPRHPSSAASEWLQHRPTGPTPVGVLRDVTLVAGPSDLISPLWSLQWEVIFSLLLPLYMWVALAWPRLFWVKLVGAFALVAVGAFSFTPAFYLPMFAVGVLLATRMGWLAEGAKRIGGAAWAALTVIALLLLTARWLAGGVNVPDGMIPASYPCILLGATLLIFVAAFCPAVRTVLEQRWAQWLGRISFSLYLIHEPIVIALGYTIGRRHAWAVLPLAVLICLPVAAVFFRFVEGPAHSLARQVGRRWTKAPGALATSA